MEVNNARRSAYMQRYHKEHPRKGERVFLTLSSDEYADLEELAKRHNVPLAAFVKSAVFGYIKGEKVIPKGVDDGLAVLIGHVRRIGTNINQIARHANTHHKLAPSDMDELLDRLDELEDRVNDFLRKPE